VGKQQNGRSEVPMLLHAIYSCGVDTDHNKERWTNRSNKFDTFFAEVPVDRVAESVYFS
jgi:hypothetical protein